MYKPVKDPPRAETYVLLSFSGKSDVFLERHFREGLTGASTLPVPEDHHWWVSHRLCVRSWHVFLTGFPEAMPLGVPLHRMAAARNDSALRCPWLSFRGPGPWNIPQETAVILSPQVYSNVTSMATVWNGITLRTRRRRYLANGLDWIRAAGSSVGFRRGSFLSESISAAGLGVRHLH